MELKYNKIILIILILFTAVSCRQMKLITEKYTLNKNMYKFDWEIEKALDSGRFESDFQYSATQYFLKGNYKKALVEWDKAFEPKIEEFNKEHKDSILNKFTIKKARSFIIDMAENKDIVIINETHHNSYHKVFTESLLNDLYGLGYKVLCLEALQNGEKKDFLLNNRGYPTNKTGFYTNNPQFGNMIREALNIGYKIFPYETTKREGGESREIEQANNLYEIMVNNPNDKFIVYCGYGHSFEGKTSQWNYSLAERIKQLSGKDPLTIDQVNYSEKSKWEFSPELIKIVEPENEAFILVDSITKLPLGIKLAESWIDVSILQPKTNYVYKRPKWLFSNKKSVKINIKSKDFKFPIMISAFKPEDDLDSAVPLDIIEVPNPSLIREYRLALNKGKYKILVVDSLKNNKVYELKVN